MKTKTLHHIKIHKHLGFQCCLIDNQFPHVALCTKWWSSVILKSRSVGTFYTDVLNLSSKYSPYTEGFEISAMLLVGFYLTKVQERFGFLNQQIYFEAIYEVCLLHASLQSVT